MLSLCTVQWIHYKFVLVSYLNRFLEISSSTVTCAVTGNRENRGGGYCLEVPCRYSFKGNSLVVKWVSGRSAKERKIVEDALARNQEGRKQQRNNSGESCISATKARNNCLIKKIMQFTSKLFFEWLSD